MQLKPKKEDIRGKDILLIEDIVDQGFTLSKIQNHLSTQRLNSLKTCVLLTKRLYNPTPEVKEFRKSLTLDYVGFSVPDRWVAGYGIDSGHNFRQIPDIIVVKKEKYSSGK